MPKNNYYAVKVGRKPDIYKTWAECQQNTSGFSGAKFHAFEFKEDAIKYMEETDEKSNANTKSSTIENTVGEVEIVYPYAFVDGSYNDKTKTYGYGGILKVIEEEFAYILRGSGNESNMVGMRNVAGEVLGAIAAIEMAIKLELESINIYYDYMGIEEWATGNWKAGCYGTIAYVKFIKESRNKIKINFVKVKAHSNIEGNEIADKLAKEAVGIF